MPSITCAKAFSTAGEVPRGEASAGLLSSHTLTRTASVPPWDDARHHVLEAWLCAQQGHDGVLTGPGKCCNTMGLQLHTHRTSIHVSLLGNEDGGSADSLSSCR